jgi:3-hydroxybutyrate dehydrogenase
MPADYGLKGHAAIVTGSTSGIGHAMAQALAREGVNVMLNGLGDPARIEADRAALEQETGARVLYHGADMTRPAEIADLVATAHREFGRLDILFNNAGVQHVSPVEDFPPEKWDQIIAINLTSAFHSTRAAIPLMKAQGRGRIVNLASVHGLVASPFKSAYVAAKHGLVGFTKSTALELARTGITVNSICPGWVKTPLVMAQMADQARTHGVSEDRVLEDVMLVAQPNKRFIEYQELGGLLLYLVSDMGASATGSNFAIDGGWTAA